MFTTSRSRKLLSLSIAVVAAAGIGLGGASSSYADDNASANTDAVVADPNAGQVTGGTEGTFTTTIANPATATADEIAADPSSTLSSRTSVVASAMVDESPNVDYASSSATRGGSITRGTVMARAQSWVDEGVPYNQQGYHTDANGTYREDCSGFVSMAWNLPVSRTTWTLPDVATAISKSAMQPGDILDYTSEHVILFAGWKDKSAGTFYYYAESNPRVLTNEYVGNLNASTIAGWPAGDYTAYRYNNIAADAVPVTAGTFYHSVRSTSGTWANFNPLHGANGAATFAGSQESITGLPNGSSQVVGIGLDGNIYHTGRNVDGSWTAFDHITGANGATYFHGSDVAIAGMPDGSSQLVAIGNDGNIWHRVRNGDGSWTVFHTILGLNGAPAFKASRVQIAAMPDGSSQVLAYGADKNMYLDIRYANGSWSGWTELAGANGAATFQGPDLAITGLPDGSSQILAIGNNGSVYHEVRSAAGVFSGFQAIPGVTTTAMGASSIGIAGMPNGSSQVVAVGTDGNVWQTTRNASGTWTSWTAPAGIGGAAKFAAGQVGIAAMPDGTTQVLATTH
ncbi:hypothetical protein [Peterkaempfera sp. SMS 1(5)a]|uniref:hypothetical protein n=1 Tax=Peterkaempfera podocarpi TaxID=3232308 RepID=UPI00366B9B53